MSHLIWPQPWQTLDLNGKASRKMGISYTQNQNWLRYNWDVGLARGSELLFKAPY